MTFFVNIFVFASNEDTIAMPKVEYLNFITKLARSLPYWSNWCHLPTYGTFLSYWYLFLSVSDLFLMPGCSSRKTLISILLWLLYDFYLWWCKCSFNSKSNKKTLKLCGSGSVSWSGLDPDSIGSLDPDSESGSGYRRAKMTHKSRKFFFLSSCFEVLDGLFWELKASSVTWTFFMEA